CSAFRGSDRFTVTRSVQKGRGISLSRRDLPVISALVSIRQIHHSVGVEKANYRGAPAEDCAYLVERLCSWLSDMGFGGELALPGAMIKAILAHLYLAWIHPFGDGNGRTARLMEAQILMSSGVPSPAAHLMSNHYNETRSEYYAQLNRSSKSGGDVIPFLAYALRGFRDGLREQIQHVKTLQHKIAWTNFVHEAFSGRKSIADHRRRRLALELAEHEKGVKLEPVKTLNGAIALEYANKTGKTLMRDLHELTKLKLITVRDRVVFPNRDLILAFLPVRAQLTRATEKEIIRQAPLATEGGVAVSA
ncbi:MAG: Fic family protein, partial [Candidatus Acidiferrum sp.]